VANPCLPGSTTTPTGTSPSSTAPSNPPPPSDMGAGSATQPSKPPLS
jgi:hypothetical protein